jgi:hypothetical protein
MPNPRATRSLTCVGSTRRSTSTTTRRARGSIGSRAGSTGSRMSCWCSMASFCVSKAARSSPRGSRLFSIGTSVDPPTWAPASPSWKTPGESKRNAEALGSPARAFPRSHCRRVSATTVRNALVRSHMARIREVKATGRSTRAGNCACGFASSGTQSRSVPVPTEPASGEADREPSAQPSWRGNQGIWLTSMPSSFSSLASVLVASP